MAGMWCIALLSSIMVVGLVLLIGWLIIWNLIGIFEAKVSKFIQNFVMLAQDLIDFFQKLIDFIVAPIESARERLISSINDISDKIRQYFNQDAADSFRENFIAKVDLYAERTPGVIDQLKELNAKIANGFTSLPKNTRSKIENSLNNIDSYFVEPFTDDIKRRILINDLINNLSKHMNMSL